MTDGPGEAAFDCLLGLAADAVGAGRAADANKRFTQASAVIEGHGGDWWRQRVRLNWVRAEIAMLNDGVIVWRGPASEIDRSGNPYVDQFVQGLAEGPIKPAI